MAFSISGAGSIAVAAKPADGHVLANVLIGTAPGKYDAKIPVGGPFDLNALVKEIAVDRPIKLYFAVTAKLGDKESPPSNEVVRTMTLRKTTTTPVVPQAPILEDIIIDLPVTTDEPGATYHWEVS